FTLLQAKSQTKHRLHTMNKPSYVCIIPTYNEGERVLHVLSEIVKSKLIDEIICVNDGSTDNTTVVISQNYPEVRLLSLSANKGKTEAIRLGAIESRNEYVLLLDADLRSLNFQEIDAAL